MGQLLSPSSLLSTLNAKAAEVSGAANAGAAQISSNAAAMQESFKTQENLTRQNAESAGVIESTKQFAQLAVEDALARNALNLGGDLADVTGLQSKLATQYIQARTEQQAALQSINQKNTTSFFDDPLGWIGAKLTVNDDIARHNAAEATAEQAAAQIKQTNDLITGRAVAANTLKQTVTQASAQAAIEQVKNNALIAAETYRQQGLTANTRSIQEIVQLRSADMAAVSTSYDAAVKNQQLGIAQQHLAQSVAAESRQVQEFNWRKASEEEKQKVGTYVQENIIRGYKTLYPSQPEKWEVPGSPKMLALISGKIPLDGELKQAYELGVLNSKIDPSGQTRILATSPVELLKVLQYSPELNAATKPVISLIRDAAQNVQADPKYKALVQSKDVQGATDYLNGTIRETFKQQATKVSGPDNPYWLPNITELAAQSPGIKEFPLYTQVLAPLATAGVDTSDPGTVFLQSIKAVKDGKIGLNQMAIQLSAIYRQGQRVNIASKQLTNLGITPIESYNVKINTGGLLDATVNMADPNAIIRAAMNAQRSEIFNSNPFILGANLPKQFGPQITYTETNPASAETYKRK